MPRLRSRCAQPPQRPGPSYRAGSHLNRERKGATPTESAGSVNPPPDFPFHLAVHGSSKETDL
eukprot:scaffold81095_cov35-Tisochrysis_lutea.AAC.4